jgi:soluble lytic murein transglycosylase-like protein
MAARGSFWWLLGGAALLYALASRQQLSNIAQSGVDTVTAALSGWKSVQQGPRWLAALNAAEARYGIPPDLLARVAYQESHFRPDIITGATVSPAGALGLMQLMPAYFASVQVPRPYSDSDTLAQIEEAARELRRLYGHFNDWLISVAAYNWGQGNVDHALAASVNGPLKLPAETNNYVAQVFADVPLSA